jgi:hypothetical protein
MSLGKIWIGHKLSRRMTLVNWQRFQEIGVWCTCYILKCKLLCVQFYLLFQKYLLAPFWFVVYDGMPCWNMIGQNEDWLLYTNTGQAFSIDTKWKSPLNISLLQSFSLFFIGHLLARNHARSLTFLQWLELQTWTSFVLSELWNDNVRPLKGALIQD